MEVMAQEWTDGRLDALNQKVDLGFQYVDQRFDQIDQRFEKVDTDIRELRGQVAGLQRTMIQGFIGLAAAMVAGFGTLGTMIILTAN